MERVDEPNPYDVTAKDALPPLSPGPARSATWKWFVCGLLFLATMIMYMDRQTLAFTIKRIKNELSLTSQQYGRVEKGFGLAFAVGALAIGILADRVSIRWLYPTVLVGWSLAGIATAYGAEIGSHLVSFFPWLIDPAAHGSHREFDLAMMRLFGGFSRECFAAYEEVAPLAADWAHRVLLHQIAPLVVHAIKFGGGYVGAATEAIARYT